MKKALLLIDIQNDYFSGGKMTLEGSIPASKNAAALLSAFREKHLPVIHVQHIATQVGATFFLPDTTGTAIHENVLPLEGETVIQKNFPNSFRMTGLLDHLKRHDITNLVIVGMMTHMCVDTTVRAACDLGFSCLVAHDACATKAQTFGAVTISAEQVQVAYMAALDGSFAEVLSTQDIIATL